MVVRYRLLYGTGALGVRPAALFAQGAVVDGKVMLRLARL